MALVDVLELVSRLSVDALSSTTRSRALALTSSSGDRSPFRSCVDVLELCRTHLEVLASSSQVAATARKK